MALVVAVLTIPFPMGADDTFLHIKTGEYLLTQGIPHVDPFSFATGDRPYAEHEWLTCIVFYLVYTYSGSVGMVALKTAVVSLTYILVYTTARCLGAQLGYITLAFGPLAYVVANRVIERPHILSSLFLMTYCYVFFRVRTGQLRARWLWLLPLLSIFWTNLHGGWIQGTALVACCALGEVVHWARAHYVGVSVAQALPGRTVLTLVALVPLCVAASFVNPYGLALVLHPFHQTSLRLVRHTNLEWMPVHYWLYYSPQCALWVAHLAALWGTTFVRYGARQTSAHHAMMLTLILLMLGVALVCLSPPPQTPLHQLRVTLTGPPAAPEITTHLSHGQVALLWLLVALLGLWSLFGARHWRTVDVTQMGLVLLMVGLACRYGRALQDAMLLTWPVLVQALSTLRGRRALRGPPGERGRLWMGAGLLVLVGLAGAVALWGVSWSWKGYAKALGVGIDAAKRPVCAVDFLAQQGLTGRALVNGSAAPYLLFRLWPDVTVNLDTRDYLYTEQHYIDTWDALRWPARMAAYVQQWHPDFLLVQQWDLSKEVYTLLTTTMGWHLVHMDDHYAVLVPQRPDTAALIQREGYQILGVWDNAPVTRETAPRLVEELQRVVAHCPGGTTTWAGWAGTRPR